MVVSGVFPLLFKNISPELWMELKETLKTSKKEIGNLSEIRQMRTLSHKSLEKFSVLLFEALRCAACMRLVFRPGDRIFRQSTVVRIQGQDMYMANNTYVGFSHPSIHNDRAVFGGQEKQARTWKLRWGDVEPDDLAKLITTYEEKTIIFSTGVSECPAKRLVFNIFKLFLMNLVENFDLADVAKYGSIAKNSDR